MRRLSYIFLLFSVSALCGGCFHIGTPSGEISKLTSSKTDSSKDVSEETKGRDSGEDASGDSSSKYSDDDSPTINDMDELCAYVSERLENGDTEITFTTDDLSVSEIQQINSSLDGYYGNVSQCRSSKNAFRGTSDMSLDCQISDNYYVERYIKDGTAIPDNETEAAEIATVCEDILESMSDDLGENASAYEKELWIHDYLVLHTAYGYPDGEQDQSSSAHESYGALVSHKAVCNGYAFAMKLLCDLSDIPCKIITGTGDGESHAWNLVMLDDQWYHVDVTWDDPSPDQEGRVVYTYFNINDERASLGHQWQEGNYPKAQADRYNYYIINDLFCSDYDAFKEKCIAILEDDSQDSFQVMVGDYDGSIYSDQNMDFLFEYCDADSVTYQNLGEIPYETLYISLE